jgi:hypothetical protein
MSGLFRSWSGQLPPTGKDPELLRLEKLAEEAREKLNTLREHGRLLRAHRLESLDALETRRMTLHEILKRMEKEIVDKNVDDYADILAEVFGERVIYAHRAIGLEALLCQFMHQMLAKQHQLKILKRAAKDLHKLFQNQKSQNREEFHSFEALAVHVETMRLSLEAQYDDIFAAQHSLLARLHHVDAGGTMTNYKVVKPQVDGKAKTKPTLRVSAKHVASSPSSKSIAGGDSDDDDEEMVNDVLTSKYVQDGELRHNSKAQPLSNNSSWTKTPPMPSANLKGASTTPGGMLAETHNATIYLKNIGPGNQTSARNRRREIEQRRLAAGRGSGRGNSMTNPDMEKAREKMRNLEASRATKDTSDSSSTTFNMAQLRAKFERKGSSHSDDDTSSENQQKNSQEHFISHGDDATRARHDTRRSEGTSSRAAATAR